MTSLTFNQLGIESRILNILNQLRFTVPTPIQHQLIPTALRNKDVVGIAQTGTGKTLAFGIPMIQQLASSKKIGLIILPTRELALQVGETLNKLGSSLYLKTAVLIGGENIRQQTYQLSKNPNIIVATPGRAIDHLERKTLKLNNVSILVLDEADRMLDMGFAPQIQKILQNIPKQRQTMLFSATMPSRITQIANSYMQSPIKIESTPTGTTPDNVTHEIFFVQKGYKISLLETILKKRNGSVLVFSRTKFNAKKISFSIKKMGYTATEIHSNRSLKQRLNALNGFKTGAYRIMVATDIASRGIDATNTELVINYDLPECPEDYVHRIGRTGRAGRKGHAISFVTPDQKFNIREIERLIKKQLPVSGLPTTLLKRHFSSINTNIRTNNSRSRQPFFNRRRVPKNRSFGNFINHRKKSMVNSHTY